MPPKVWPGLRPQFWSRCRLHYSHQVGGGLSVYQVKHLGSIWTKLHFNSFLLHKGSSPPPKNPYNITMEIACKMRISQERLVCYHQAFLKDFLRYVAGILYWNVIKILGKTKSDSCWFPDDTCLIWLISLCSCSHQSATEVPVWDAAWLPHSELC